MDILLLGADCRKLVHGNKTQLLNNYKAIQENRTKTAIRWLMLRATRIRLQDEKETKSIPVVQPLLENSDC
jgi:hypothetical protein